MQGENFYENIISAQIALGLHPHPNFKRLPDHSKRTGLIDPDLGPALEPPQLKNPPEIDDDDDEYVEPTKQKEPSEVDEGLCFLLKFWDL